MTWRSSLVGFCAGMMKRSLLAALFFFALPVFLSGQAVHYEPKRESLNKRPTRETARYKRSWFSSCDAKYLVTHQYDAPTASSHSVFFAGRWSMSRSTGGAKSVVTMLISKTTL